MFCGRSPMTIKSLTQIMAEMNLHSEVLKGLSNSSSSTESSSPPSSSKRSSTMAANTGIVSIHGKQYKTVALRVAKFRAEHPDWAIITDIYSVDDAVVIMKAT